MILSPTNVWRRFFPPRKPIRNRYYGKSVDVRSTRLTAFHESRERQEREQALHLSAQRRAITKLLPSVRQYTEKQFQDAVQEELNAIYAEQERPYATMLYLPAIRKEK
jgi:hypothetical protein